MMPFKTTSGNFFIKNEVKKKFHFFFSHLTLVQKSVERIGEVFCHEDVFIALLKIKLCTKLFKANLKGV
jgi:hypothetical protein